MNGVQLAGRTCGKPKSTTSKTIPTLRMTISLLTRADSLSPMTNTADISATMPTAGRLTMAPVRFSPGWAQPTAWAVTWAMVTAHAVGCAHPGLNLTGAIVNLPAVGIVALMSAVLVIGLKESARVNRLIVILKVGIVLLVVLFGLPHVRPANWTPFIPPNTGEWGSYGWSGV